METLFGAFLVLTGISMFILGIRMFIKSDEWFYLAKAILVIITGLVMFGVSLELLGF